MAAWGDILQAAGHDASVLGRISACVVGPPSPGLVFGSDDARATTSHPAFSVSYAEGLGLGDLRINDGNAARVSGCGKFLRTLRVRFWALACHMPSEPLPPALVQT